MKNKCCGYPHCNKSHRTQFALFCILGIALAMLGCAVFIISRDVVGVLGP